jgi:hypothetical protein
LGVQKGHAQRESWYEFGFDPIGKTHAEPLAVELLHGLWGERREDDVPESLIAGDEPGRHQRRLEGLRAPVGTGEQLDGNAAWVLELIHTRDAAAARDLVSGFGGRATRRRRSLDSCSSDARPSTSKPA